MFFFIKRKSQPRDESNKIFEDEDWMRLQVRSGSGAKKKTAKKKTTKKKPASRKKAASKKKKASPVKRRKNKGRSGKRRRGCLGSLLRLAFMAIVLGAASGVLLLFLGIWYFDHQAAEFDMSKVGSMPRESVIYDRHGEEIGRLQADRRTVVPLKKVSPFFLDALLAREDKRFYDHGGIDYRGVARAFIRNIKDRGVVQGASTLTMQLARNSYELRERSFKRKFLEMALARRIEATYSKDEILEFYVNRIFLGSGLFGVEKASQAYFGHAAADLSLGEAAMLAGIIRAPNRFSPFRHYQSALEERDMVLERLLAEGMITAEEKDKAERQAVKVKKQNPKSLFSWFKKSTKKAPSTTAAVMGSVRRELRAIMGKAELESGGLEIHTTIDLQLQAAAERAVELRLRAIENTRGYPHRTMRQFEARWFKKKQEKPDYLQAALVMIDNENGAVRAMVGGRNYQHSQYNRALVGKRTVGSVFKPLVYAAAFESGTFPGTLISDNPIRKGEIKWHSGNWSPRNSDGKYLGLQPAEIGLIRSRNTMSVRVGERAGIDTVREMAIHAGLSGSGSASKLEKSPQLYIGNMSATLEAVTSAYTVFPNEGYRLRPYLIDSIKDRRNHMVYQNRQVGYRVLTPAAAWTTSQILEKVMADGGTGSSARKLGFTAPSGGKTGTTNDYQDAWFLGYSSRLTGGVWVGLDQPERIVDHGYGSRLALPIWVEVMKVAAKMKEYAPGDLPDVSNLVKVELCRISGKLASANCRKKGKAYQSKVPGTLVPRSGCSEAHGAASKQQKRPVSKSRPSFFSKLKKVFSKKQ
ncbi:MAG: PBP1A family penicillin-binding protein [Verrucomicrobiales bacterium]|nr:PBP1A family penicillin-binding protein [Verrucomicrobiales bacterium]